MLAIAARAGLRGMGDVEPNPMVGCVIGTRAGEVLGVGHHRSLGGPHAEVEALRSAERAGRGVRGATAWVTLEPCAHTGRTPPCVDALASAGIAEVVCAREDTSEAARGGGAALRSRGVSFRVSDACAEASALAAPFAKRAAGGGPWVIAKWAQTLDGRIATRTGESRWISCEKSRRRVHRMRARVGAVVVGAGTALMDDPALTARGVRRVRRVAVRVVLDTTLRLPAGSALARTARETPVIVFCGDETTPELERREMSLRSAGVEVVRCPLDGASVDAAHALRWLASERGVSSALVEAGPRLLGALIERELVDEAHAFIAPGVMGDESARPVASGRVVERLAHVRGMTLVRLGRSGADAHLILRRG